MTHNDLINSLRHIAPDVGSPRCLGCGYEHNCSIHGCAIIRAAVEELGAYGSETGTACGRTLSPQSAAKVLRSANLGGVLRTAADMGAEALLPPPNDPLTLEELREMDWEPVWVKRSNGTEQYYIAVSIEIGPDLYRGGCGYEGFSDYGKTWLAYRRKPEEAGL